MGQKLPDSSVDRYRRRAQDLRAIAKASKNAETQRELLVLAQQYEKLADDVRRHER